MDREAIEIDWQPVLVAAGTSARFGGANKLLAAIGGVPVILHSLRFLMSVACQRPPIVVTSDEVREAMAGHPEFRAVPDTVIIGGGERRRDSVQAALERATGEYVAVHDGARPLATGHLLRRLLRAAEGHPGAVPAIPVTDTIIRVDSGQRFVEHVARSILWTSVPWEACPHPGMHIQTGLIES